MGKRPNGVHGKKKKKSGSQSPHMPLLWQRDLIM